MVFNRAERNRFICPHFSASLQSRWLVFATVLLIAPSASGQNFVVRRMVSGLNSPTYVTQAPGDNDSLYITELGGSIMKLDLTTGALSTFATIEASTHWTTGLHTMTFHPDYQNNGKFYVARGLDPYGSFTTFVNRVDEFVVDGGGTVSFSRNFLEEEHLYVGNGSHAIDWVGFDPTDPNSDTLYATIGDGLTNASKPDTSPLGKVLAFDTADANPT